MYYGESVQERGGSSNSWNNGSNMLLRHQHAVLIGFTLLIYSLQGYTNVQAVDQVITEKEGQTVVVPCPVNKDKCGELHSLNWFKGDNRIAAMLLDDSNVTSVAEGFEDRVSVEQNPFRLIIRNLEIADQDIYLCDTTYFIPIETCDNFNGHRVELKVLVPPSEMVIWDEKGDRIANGTVIGPMQERQMLNLTCVVRNTTPMPEVGWYRGSELLPEVDIHYDDKDGLFNVTVELYLKLTRKDLAHNIECRAKSAAIQNTLSTQFSIDLQVRPTNIHINGVEKYTVQGSKVVLTCSVYGARPPVNLTWYNSTQTIDPAENDLTEIRTKAIEQADGTFYTQSELLFNATRFENDKEFRCEAENIVVKMNGEKPFQALLGLEVFYPPVIDVNPLNATVNTGDSVLLYCDYVANPATLKSVLWYRNGVSLNVSDSDHYKGGNSEHVALSIRHAVKEDIGNYTCELTNEAGQGISEEQINLDVLYVPTVEVLMTPVDSVKESEEANVTLICKIIDANPPILTKVRWYANSTLLKELPDCEETKEDLCHIDPSKLLLESIGRGFFYNYSCEGYNDAGWGPRSEDKELLVLYEPGPATIAHFPLIAVKKKSVTFSCSVDDPGYPETNSFRWLRGGRASSSDTKDYTIEPVGLDSRTNYSCYAMNAGGKGAIATVNLEVHAPPFFIKNLPPYTGMLHTSRNANLTCRIECVPRCEISWLKDGVPIEKNDTRYFVKDKYMDASPATGDFESMLSVLHFNMSNWPNNKFDIEGDNANYTCISTGNAVGPGIKSATYFSIEYAPDNTTVSEEVVYVAEETTPGRVMCKSRANPEPTYEWHFNDKPLIQGSALIINTGMTRNESGRYTCVAFNKHGRSTAETVIDVQYKPRCEIERKEIDDQDTLICTAYGNPEEADFSWSIKAENESVEALGSGDSKTFKDKSYYVLKEDYEIARTYRCVANNTVGVGAFCEIEVAEQLAWWQRWDKPALIILVASILVLLLAVIIICCIIICICRRRRRQDKYRTDVSMSATHSVLSYQPTIPQLITGGNTVLPDTLKMPIMSSMLVPTLAAAVPQIEEHVQIPKTITTATQMTQQQETKTTTQQTPSANVKFTLRQNISNKPTTLDTKATPPSPTQTTTTSTTTTAIASTAPSNNSTLTTTSNHSHTGTRTATTTPTLSVRHCTQAPKSPPRWPLRPGVMVHVSSDTKENLAVNRMTLKPTATLANLTASTVNDSSMSSSTLNTSVSNNNSTQTTLLNVTGTDCGTGIPQNTATLGRGSGIPGRVDNFNAKQVVVDRLLANNSNNNNNNEQTNIIPTNLDCTKTDTKATKMMMSGEISLDLQTELRVMDAKQTGQGKQQEGIEIEKFTAAAAAQEKEICVDVTPRNDDEMGIQGTKKEICKKSRLERVEDFIVKIFFKRRRSSPSNTCRDSQRSHVGLLGGKFWKRPDGNGGTAIASSTSPFATEHRLKGIRSSGSAVQEKSSSMADPLTEPGEYENLPFHGLQTAPNKFTTPTTPTNFNNNTNVVRSVPRPKRLNGNISQTAGAAATYYGEHENDSQPQQQQQHYQQQQYSTIPSNRILANGTTRNEGGVIVHNNNSLAANTLQHNQNISDAASPNPHQMTYNLNNCFPKSYTEYYQNQQQQQHHQFQQKYGNSLSLSSNTHSSQLHGIEHDFNTYAVVERPHNTPTSSASSSMAGRTTNPFLAVSNFKKFDASGDEEVSGANGGVGNYQTTSMKRQGKRKTFIDKLEDRRFYSLKFAGNKHKQPNSKNAPVHFNASLIETSGSRVTPESGLMSAAAARAMGSLLGAGGGNDNKCKRHHSFAGGSLGDIESKGPVMRNGLHFYDPPAYENVNDAVQVHAAAVLSDMELPDPKSSAGTATVLLHPLPSYGSHNGVGGSGGSQGPKKKHHQRQHQPKEDLNLIEPERLSIYRSDSGISNSSYECVTPIPNGGGTQRGSSPSGKTPRTPKTPKTPKGHKNQTLAHSAVTASFNTSQKKPAPRVPSAPLYMNLNDQAPNGAGVGNLERPSSPNSTIATSAYESASSSQNDTTCNDPTSMSSTNSLYSNNKSMVSGALRCNRHQQPPELTTPEEYEQYQLGHHSHTHSASSLSVASSISASGNPNGIGRNTKCKKQQRSLGGANVNLMELNKRPLAHNSFLATNSAATTTTTCSKKFRRQTISDPYAHIKDINECEQWRQLQQYLAANHGDMQANNYCPKSPNAFKASAAVVVASTATEPSACVIAKSQQHEWRQSQQQQSQQNGTQSKNALANIQRSQSLSVNSSLPHHQQQMLMYYNETNDNFANKVGIMADPSMPASKNDNDHDNIRPSRKKRATVPIQQLGDHGLGRANLEKDSQSLSITHKNLSGRNAADSVDGHFDDVALTKEEKGLFHHQKQLQKHPSQKAKLPLTFTTAAAAALAPNQSLSDDLLANCIGRPVKLPLRKYHSFHFQPTQTVAGQQHLGNLQQLRAKQQQMQTILNFPQHMLSDDDNLNSTYNHKGPLVFRPYQVNEEVTFKPIQPSEESEDSMELQQDGSTPEIPKRQGEVYMDSGDFTNFTKLSTPKRHSSEENEEPPQLPKTAPPANFSDIKKLYGDMEINFETRTVTGASLTKAVHTPEERGSRTQELKTALNSGCGNTKTNISSLLQKSPKSGFSKPGIDYLGVSYITAANEKSPKTTRTQMKTATLNLDLNKNSPSIESPQHFKMLQKTLTANNNTPDSWGQAKLKQLGEIYKLSSSESSEEDKDSPAAKQKSQRKLNFSNDRQKQKPTLNPAASLEALEMLTKSQPELWRSNHAGSRQNLHQLELFHSLQKTKLQEKSQKAREDDDDEDLGYSFCEDDIDDNDDVKELGYAGSPKKIPQHSPRVTDIMAAGKDQENQVKFKLTQTHQEVQIFANKVGIMADPSMPASKNDNDHDNIRPSRKKRATVPIQQLGDHGLGRANLEKDSQSLSITHKNLSGRNAADSVDGHFDDVALTKEEKGLFHHQKQLQKHPSQKAKLPLTFTTAAAAALAPNQSLSDDLLANCIGRPVKLPLRKYHSFHFQPTQTVAGQQHLGNLQQLRAKQQQMQTILNFPQHMLSDDDNLNSTYNHKGPLVFRPYQVNEEVTFKPIQPSEESEDSMELQQDGSTPEIPKRQGEVYMDSGDFTNFTKLSTPKRHSSEENEEPPQLPKTAPPANFSDIKKLYGDMEINFETRTVTGASLTKAVHTPEERGSRTQELKTALNSGCGNTKTNISSLLQKSPKSGFSKPGIDYLGVSYITAANEKSPKTTRTQMKTATLNLDLNKNSPSIESPQHFKMLQKTLTANNNTPDSWGQAKLKQLGEIYKLSSSESSEEDKDSPAAKQKSQRKLNFSNDRQKQKPTLNPAASLEALEMLTKSQPELWRSNHAGSRQNLHQLELFHSLQKTKLQEKSQKAREDDDDEDLGYSFCEDDIDDNDDVKELGYAGSPKKIPQHSPRVTDIMAAGKDQENQVKFKLTQTHQEVQI
uniref:Ig-like domain-containing protein n=1 Tax=Stomoxys calcitrans TaxID=35570 RepID=A0A1I8PB86_STOCA